MLWLCLHLPNLRDAPVDSAPRPDPAAALQGFASWAWQFTDRVSVTSRESSRDGPPFDALLLEIEGSLKLFGGLPALRARICESFAAFDQPFRCAVAPTPAAAELLALTGSEASVAHRSLLRAHLAQQPLAALALPHGTLESLSGVGLRTVGEALTLSPAQLTRRFGTEAALYLRCLAGEAPDPRPMHGLPPGWRRRCELGHPTTSLEALGFVMKRLLLELEGVLVARDNAVMKLALGLEHEDAPASSIELALSAPRRDAAQWLPLLRERLERAPMPEVTALVLEVTEFADNPYGQHDLFDEHARRATAARALIERLVARLGEQAVRGVALREDHRPEMSFVACPFVPERAAAPKKTRGANGAANDRKAAARPAPRLGPSPSPFWLLRKPQLLRRAPPAVGKPQRIESGWWDGAGVARDYYVAETPAGERLWVFREKEQWFLHGLWA